MLPIHDIESELRSSLEKRPSRFLLKAPTGSGKSTTVPSIILDAISSETSGKILVVQPRRMACRLLAEYVSTLEKSPLGQKVGYTVRFENKSSAKTKILFITDGILQRLLLDNPDLDGIDAVLFDEFHERRLASDLALARILELQKKLRPDLHLGVMSATLKIGGLENYLHPCTALETGGRLHPVEILHRSPDTTIQKGQNQRREKMLWDHIADAVRDEAPGQADGTRILVFLPGTHEIRKTQQALENTSSLRSWEITPLYSALPPAQQKAAIESSNSRRIILATNVAETSLTIPGVTLVIDSGLHRTNLYDPRRGIDSLRIEKISQASAEQRAGRAGRTAPGRAIRLWSEADQHRRPSFDLPEIKRVDLSEAILFLKRLGYKDLTGDTNSTNDTPFYWLDAPPTEMLNQALDLLTRLGALDPDGDITELGYDMSRWPLHPRLARLLMAGVDEGCLSETAFIAAAISSEGLFKKGTTGIKWSDFADKGDLSDFAAEWNALQSARHANFHPGQCNTLGILARGARETDKAFQQFTRLLEQRKLPLAPVNFHQNEEALQKALLHAFNDRLCARRDNSSAVCHLIGADGRQRSGKLDPKSVIKRAPLFLATSIIEIEGKERSVLLSRGTTITEELLAELFPGEITTSSLITWDEISRRIVSSQSRHFRQLPLSESRSGQLQATDLDPISAAKAAEILSQKVITGELVLKKWDSSVERYLNRLNFLAAHMPELELPAFTSDDQLSIIQEVCLDKKQGGPCLSYRDLKERDPWPTLKQWLSAPQKAALDSYAPENLKLSNNRNVKVHYPQSSKAESHETPHIEPFIDIRAQHLFGVQTTPTLPSGYPLLIKILSPNQRPYQTTKDLANFWKTGFPQMKKDLAGRYPKHQWDLP